MDIKNLNLSENEQLKKANELAVCLDKINEIRDTIKENFIEATIKAALYVEKIQDQKLKEDEKEKKHFVEVIQKVIQTYTLLKSFNEIKWNDIPVSVNFTKNENLISSLDAIYKETTDKKERIDRSASVADMQAISQESFAAMMHALVKFEI